jgi:hypothetical protein
MFQSRFKKVRCSTPYSNGPSANRIAVQIFGCEIPCTIPELVGLDFDQRESKMPMPLF